MQKATKVKDRPVWGMHWLGIKTKLSGCNLKIDIHCNAIELLQIKKETVSNLLPQLQIKSNF